MEEEKKIEDETVKPIISIKNLNFSYDAGKPNIIGLDCVLQPNSRAILVGANGAGEYRDKIRRTTSTHQTHMLFNDCTFPAPFPGKSTLMRILTGQIFMGMEHEEFSVNGKSRVNDQFNGVAYLGGTWKRRRTGFEGVCPYSMDCAASEMMQKWQEQNVERRDELVRVLGINLKWRMHECSDGQRKKVRIMIKLLRPFQLCVIDEFAADLDIFSRKRFFDYLTRECDKRGASVMYCTHIFDQADEWATHIAYMQLNKVLSPVHCLATYPPYQDILARTGANRAMCPMYTLVLEELERQYLEQSNLFVGDNQCLTDVIMENEGKELGADRHESERAGDQTGWVSGRLTRQLNAKEQEERREERFAKTAALEKEQAGSN